MPINWATGVDLKTRGARSRSPTSAPAQARANDICPNLIGGKNWQPMSFNPQTGLVYIPTINLCMDMEGVRARRTSAGKFYLGVSSTSARPGPAATWAS